MEQAQYAWTFRSEDWHWWFVGRRKLAQALIEPRLVFDSVEPILDLGCGTAGNLALLARWGNVTGLDLSSLALSFARRRQWPHLVQGSGPALPYPNDIFNLVTAFDVLYHRWITNDQHVLEECYRVLRPAGWLLITNPALPGLWSAHDKVYYARERYKAGEIHQKLINAGFRRCFCSYSNILLLPVMAAMRLMARWLPLASRIDQYSPPPWLNQWLIDIHNLETDWLRRGRTLPIGSSLVCLAQKPAKEK